MAANDSSTESIAGPMMTVFAVVFLIGFCCFKSKLLKIISSLLATLFICNLIVFSSLYFANNDFFVYSRSYILGSILSFYVFYIVSEVKEKHF